MLIRVAVLERIRDGAVTCQFRRWARPRVKVGSVMHTAVGQVAVDAVDTIDLEGLTEDDARSAGADDLEALVRDLERRSGEIYRIRLRWVGEDPRISLRETRPSEEALEQVLLRVGRWDAGSRGPWVLLFLQTIRDRPATRAADLADALGWDTPRFKAHVRKLKGLGLTESLEVGYRLSPRGSAVLEALERL